MKLIPFPEGAFGLDAVLVDPADPVAVGRSSRCQVRLPVEARSVSRLHATLFSRDGAWYVLDESRHGTFLQGQRLKRGEPAAVRHGDRLRFGDCEFVVQSSAPAHDAERIDPLQYRLSVQTVDLSAAVDASRVLQSALELPERLGNAATEAQMYAAACEYLVKTLSPAIAAAYVTVGDADSKLEVLGRAARDGEGARPELLRPIVSRRILQRLRDAPDSVVFLQRKLADATLDATVNSCTRSLGASWLEADALDRPTVLHIVGDQVLGDGEQLVAQYLRLVSTLLRQHMRTLRNAHLATYFSPKVVELLMKKGGRALIEGSPRLSCCTSLFFDVRGSSPAIAAAALDLTRVYTELRAIIEDVTDAIFETDGTIIDYAGDGVFAAWGIPFEQPDQALLATRCALSIIRRLKCRAFTALNPRGPLCGIGIAKGEVLVGAVGSALVAKYGLLGPSVNAAQRLAMQRRPSFGDAPILVTADVVTALTGSDLKAHWVDTLRLSDGGAQLEIFQVGAEPLEIRPWLDH